MTTSEYPILIKFLGRKPYRGLPGHTKPVPESDFCAVRAAEYDQIKALPYPGETTVDKLASVGLLGYVGAIEQSPMESYWLIADHPTLTVNTIHAILVANGQLNPNEAYLRGSDREFYEYPAQKNIVVSQIFSWTSIEELVKMIDAKLGT